MAGEISKIYVPSGDHSLVESERLSELEKVSEIAKIFGITASTTINLATLFRVYRMRLGLSHAVINSKTKISRMTLRKIEGGEQPTIQERTALKLIGLFGDEFGVRIRTLGFVKDGRSTS